MRPLAIDLYAGLGGWAEGFLAEGFDVIGFDVERHDYGTGGYPGQLVIQDVLTLHGSQFCNADVIVASPPCQEFSYLAMPWSRGKQIAAALRGLGEFPEGYTGSRTVAQMTALFDACFRIQREASQAAGRHIPMVVENVKGAQPWVGRAAWHHGSYYLWGDVPALMPFIGGMKNSGGSWFGQRDGITLERNDPRDVRRNEAGEYVNAEITGGWNRNIPVKEIDGTKRPGRKISTGFNNWPKDESGAYIMPDGTKVGGDWFSDPASPSRQSSSRSFARKSASAQIAKIPFALASHIARVYQPVSRGGGSGTLVPNRDI